MKPHSLQQTATFIAGQMLCAMFYVMIFALLGEADSHIILSSFLGVLIAAGNYGFLSLFAHQAADRAVRQDVTGAQKLLRLSYLGRMAGLFLILTLCAKSGICNLIALVIPLACTTPILTAAEFLHRKGGTSS